MAVIKIKNNYLTDISGFSWGITQGANPYVTSIVVPIAQAGDYIAKEEITIQAGSKEIKKVYVTEVRALNSAFAQITLADRRYFWDLNILAERRVNSTKQVVTGISTSGTVKVPHYNLTRRTGQTITFTKFNDAGLVKIRYIPYSLKDGKTQWTYHEILYDILENFLGVPKGDIIDNAKSRTEYPENLRFDGVKPSVALNRVLSAINLTLYVNIDGKVVIHDPYSDAKTITGLALEPTQISGNINVQRPDELYLYFMKEKEILFKTGSLTDTNLLVNVVKLPADIELSVNKASTVPNPDSYINSEATYASLYKDNGTEAVYLEGQAQGQKRVYRRGEYVPIEAILECLGIDFNAFKQRYGRPDGMEYLFYGKERQGKIRILGDSTKTAKERWLMMFYNACIRDFRHLWKVTQMAGSTSFDIDRCIELTPFRVNVENPVDGTRKPAPVYCDWSEIMTNVAVAYGQKEDRSSLNHEYTLSTSAPVDLEVVDRDLGIIKTTFGFDLSGVVKSRNFGLLTQDLSFHQITNAVLWERALYKPDFTMAFPMSTVMADDLFYIEKVTLKYDGNDTPGGKGNNKVGVHVMYLDERARFDFNGEFVNEKIIKEIAKVAAEDMAHSWDTYPIGSATIALDGSTKLELTGALTSIVIGLKGDQLTATYTANSIPPIPSAWDRLDPRTRAVVFKSFGESLK